MMPAPDVAGPLPGSPVPATFVPGELEPVQGPPASLAAPPPPAAPALAPVEGPPAPPGVDTSQVVQPPAQSAQPGGANPMPTTPQGAIKDLGEAATDEQKAQALRTDAEAKAEEAKAAELDKQARETRARAEAADREMKAAEEVRGRMTTLAQQADDAVANHKFTDYKDTIPGSSKALLLLGAAMSGLAGNANPTAAIDNLIAQHFDKQKADLAKAENLSKMRREGVKDFDQHLNDRRLFLDFQERNYREALAKEAEATAARSNNPVVKAKGLALAAEMRQKADEKVVDLTSKWAQIEYQRAHAALLERTPGTKGKAGRGGGGGGRTDALAAFAEAAGKLKPGEPISTDIIKLGGRAGLKPNQIATEADKYRGSGAKAEKAAEAAGGPGGALSTREETRLQRDAKDWATEHGIVDIQKKQRELGALSKQLHDAADNPLLQALAVEKAVSAARGGAASKQALALALSHLGGTLDNADAVISKIRSGQIGPGQMRNFLNYVGTQRSAAAAEGAEANKAFNAYVDAQDPKFRPFLKAQEAKHFSGLEGFSSKGAPAGGVTDKQAAALEKLSQMGFTVVK